MRILVVEDNDLVADAITLGLSAAGFAVDRSASAEAADSALATEHFDLLVVDVGLPGQDGLSLVRRLRGRGAMQPVLILTARDTLAIKIEALNLGADDFLLKPFEQDELIARCRALIRRANLYAGEQVNLGRMRLDVAGRMLRIDEAAVDLTGREWLVLECLALNAGRVVSKDRLQQAIASFDQALTPNAVEVYVSRVRAKLGDAAVIRTVRGLGYRLDDPSS
ncbi:MAG TPA: response regulator transcription factor [Steroidobacteraceae bacterium]|jgi:DNA-binding response OmpR family regulator|nr:response regulator transcription factor [Steroidobacteraceae bacterium]